MRGAHHCVPVARRKTLAKTRRFRNLGPDHSFVTGLPAGGARRAYQAIFSACSAGTHRITAPAIQTTIGATLSRSPSQRRS
jgi:hypothetical protein